ncbi:MAG: ABC transporter ATP-binding protein [Chitinophagaceae bacterium]
MKQILLNTLSVLQLREKQKLLVLALADVFISILDIAMLAILVLLVNLYTQAEEGNIGPLSFTHKNAHVILGGVLFLFIAKNLAAYFIHKLKYGFVYSVAARISENNLLQYLEGNYYDYTDKDSAVHIRRISQQPVEFSHYVLAGFQQLFSEIIIILLTVIAILWFDATLFLLLCAVLLPPAIILSLYTNEKLRKARNNIKASSEQALQHLKEALTGYVESNVYHTHDFFTKRYSSRQTILNRHLADLQTVQVWPARFMEIFSVAGLLLLISLNEWGDGQPVVPVIALGAFLAAAYKIIPSLVKILNTSSQVKTYAFTAADLSLSPEKQDWNILPIESLNKIEVKNLSFNYADKNVLQDVSLQLQKGELTGLSGFSGRGKTTLINLLLGFLEPGNGEILFNDHLTTASERKYYWKDIAYVKQQPFLLHDTVLTNITLSNTNNDDKKLEYALKASGLDVLTGQWPEGLNTLITENGKNISGGQKQRIALARALYKNASLLLLDEPFNELDEASATAMLQILRSLAQQGKMILLITHDTKSLSFCTKIISLDAS